MKSIYKYIISILLILTSMPILMANENTSTNELLSDDYGARYIPDNILMPGESTTVHIKLYLFFTAALIKEYIPKGFKVTHDKVNYPGVIYKESTTEWVMLPLWDPGMPPTGEEYFSYILTVLNDTVPGTYKISGKTIINNKTEQIVGDDTIYVIAENILSCYRKLGADINIVETSDLLKAANDWGSDTNSPCGHKVITTEQLLELANEWTNS